MAKYEYNMMKAYGAVGKMRMALLDRRHNEPVPDPPRRGRPGGHQVRVVDRIATKKPADDYEPPPMGFVNEHYCDACRNMLRGGGYPMKVQQEGAAEDDFEYMFRHWSRFQLKLHAVYGCSLCYLMIRLLEKKDPEKQLDRSDKTPILYDYGYFHTHGVGEDPASTYAIQVNDFSGESLTKIILTLQETGTVAGLSSTPEAAAKPPFKIESAELPDMKMTSTRNAIPLMGKWLKECTENHSCMTTRDESSFLPSRLIQVGEGCCRLRSSEDIPPGARYLTLSHCWGAVSDHGAYSLTTERVKAYMQDIPLEGLPHTFVEAFMVTDMLNQAYIWIDSLCIIQDSAEDWAHESALMWEVYTNSYLNISATASSDGTQGLTRPRHALSVEPCIVQVPEGNATIPVGEYVIYSELEWKTRIDRGPVNTRAWVLQERLLAPRIVHFAEGELYWECHGLKASEKFPDGLPTAFAAQAPVEIPRNGHPIEIEEYVPFQVLLQTWNEVVSRYSQLNLTYASDKLVAISALAKQTSQAWPEAGRYLCGLWEGPLLAQLLWRATSHSSRAKDYRAPTWSWACLDGPLYPNFEYNGYEPYGDKHKFRPIAKVKAVTVEYAVPGNQYGSAASASLTVTAPLFKTSLHLRERPKREILSAAAKRAQWIETSKKLSGGNDSSLAEDYTGDGLNVHENSTPEGQLMNRLGIDISKGLMISDDIDSSPDPYGPRAVIGGHEPPIDFDTEKDWNAAQAAPSELYLLPIFCVSENFRAYNEESGEIHEVGCLVLMPETDKKGVYRRVGVCVMEENSVAELLVCLGNQEDNVILCQEVSGETLSLDDIVPEKWPLKEVEFIPKEYTTFTISIV